MTGVDERTHSTVAQSLQVGQVWRKPDGNDLLIEAIEGDCVHCRLHYQDIPESAPVDIRHRSEFVSFEAIEPAPN